MEDKNEESKPGSKALDDKCKEDVGPTFRDVLAHSLIKVDGEVCISLRKMAELEGRYGSNAGRGCDVKYGPCSCGAYH
ncbi:MAG: hypothetical protein ABIA91_02985 [Patescibacteria group bacterium]